MKLTKKQENELAKRLVHITGECGCPASSRTCTYWKNVDKCDYNWQTNEIMKLIKNLIKEL